MVLARCPQCFEERLADATIFPDVPDVWISPPEAIRSAIRSRPETRSRKIRSLSPPLSSPSKEGGRKVENSGVDQFQTPNSRRNPASYWGPDGFEHPE